MDEVFGRGYGRTLADDQMLTALGDRTAAQAIEAGDLVRAGVPDMVEGDR